MVRGRSGGVHPAHRRCIEKAHRNLWQGFASGCPSCVLPLTVPQNILRHPHCRGYGPSAVLFVGQPVVHKLWDVGPN